MRCTPTGSPKPRLAWYEVLGETLGKSLHVAPQQLLQNTAGVYMLKSVDESPDGYVSILQRFAQHVAERAQLAAARVEAY
jgi:hypothetical protein